MNVFIFAFLLLLPFSCAQDRALQFPLAYPLQDSLQNRGKDKPVAANIVFKSMDSGQTWLDISEELPENLQADGFAKKGKEFSVGDSVETWKQVDTRGRVMNRVESDGVMMATSNKGIIRSTDGGETWDSVISEGGVGIAVARIKGGFAAITYNTESKTRRVRTSYDGGKS